MKEGKEGAADTAAAGRRRLARLLTAVEGGGAEALEALRGAADAPLRLVGVSGPPGAGKSTLVGALVRAARARGRRVGVVAVDPTSPVGGGAVLGDRIRMEGLESDEGVFIRSLASRGRAGGLAPAAVRTAVLLAAHGFGEVYLETVGAGQGETAVAGVAETRVVVLAPGAGDSIQALKAGLLEIADLFVVAKADLPGAEEAAAALGWAVADAAYGWRPPVLVASARTGAGVEAVSDAIERHAAALEAGGEGARRRAERAAREFSALVEERALGALRAAPAFAETLAEIRAGRRDPYAAAADFRI